MKAISKFQPQQILQKFQKLILPEFVSRVPVRAQDCYKAVPMKICTLILLVTSVTQSSIQRATEWLSVRSNRDIFEMDHFRIYDNKFPHPNDVRRTLNSWGRNSISALYRRINKKLIREMKNSRLFKHLHHKKRPIDVAFDKTEVLYYGQNRKLSTYSRGRGKSRRCFSYLTFQIMCPGLRLVLEVEPVFAETQIGKTMVKMMRRARKNGIRIGSVYLDRGFYNVDVLEQLKSYHDLQKVVMPAIRHAGIKSAMQEWYEEHGYTAGKLKLQLGASRGKGVWYTLLFRPLTEEERAQRWNDKNKRWKKLKKDKDGNILAYQFFIYFCLPEIPEDLKNSDPQDLFNQLLLEFRRRWGIETGYKVTKGIWGWTTSTHYNLRYWLMCNAIMIYNLWVTENLDLIDQDLDQLDPDYICCEIPTIEDVKDDQLQRKFKYLPKSMRRSNEFPYRDRNPEIIEPMRYFCDILLRMAEKLIRDIISGYDPP